MVNNRFQSKDDSAAERIDMLMVEVQNGSRSAFRSLFTLTSDRAFGVLMRFLRSRSEAEDALQDVYLQVWTKSHLFIPKLSHAENWIAHIARHAAIDRLRRRGRQPQLTEYEDDHASTDLGPEDAAALNSDMRNLSACFERLDPDHAQAVQLAYMEGVTYQELAARYDVPINTLKSWLRRALHNLRDCLGPKRED